jgi:DNA-binding transcriptional regulator GbsR (MarR family)
MAWTVSRAGLPGTVPPGAGSVRDYVIWRLTTSSDLSDNSDVTELKESSPDPLVARASRQFVLSWGDLGERWGMNRSVAQVHALLYLAETPLTAEDIAGKLDMARSNVSTSLRELLGWQLIHRVPLLGERRDFYAAETDLWTIVQRIAVGRKARELDPAAAALRQCVAAAEADAALSPVVHRRLAAMLEFVDRVGAWQDDVLRLPKAQVTTLMKLGAGIARLLPGKAAQPRAGA